MQDSKWFCYHSIRVKLQITVVFGNIRSGNVLVSVEFVNT